MLHHERQICPAGGDGDGGGGGGDGDGGGGLAIDEQAAQPEQ